MFDYGEVMNRIKYGQTQPLALDITKIRGVPIGIISGNKDELVSYLDTRSVYAKLKETAVFYKEYNMGHLSFMTAKDMTFFTDVMDLIKQYHPTPKALSQLLIE